MQNILSVVDVCISQLLTACVW